MHTFDRSVPESIVMISLSLMKRSDVLQFSNIHCGSNWPFERERHRAIQIRNEILVMATLCILCAIADGQNLDTHANSQKSHRKKAAHRLFL